MLYLIVGRKSLDVPQDYRASRLRTERILRVYDPSYRTRIDDGPLCHSYGIGPIMDFPKPSLKVLTLQQPSKTILVNPQISQ